MSIYICERCGTIENTVLGGYWENILNNEIPKCSECNYGKWHGEFPKKHWTDYGAEKLLDLESRNDGSMINAREFLRNIEIGKED